jgi:hypothetical protein
MFLNILPIHFSLLIPFLIYFNSINKTTSPKKEEVNTVVSKKPENHADIWSVLLKTKYTFKESQYIPIFSDDIKALDGTTVTLKGYMYPLEEKENQDFFILSYYPVAQCFFCGGAGPESVVEVNAKTSMKMRTSALTVTGKLALNSDDPDRLFYIILNAQETY